MRDCLGCGKPPSRDDDPSKTLWYVEDEGGEVSPLQLVKQGKAPYPVIDGQGIGYGVNKMDWPWCPRWFWEFSDATVAGLPTVVFVNRAWTMLKQGDLSSFVDPPYSPGLVELIELKEQLEAERARRGEEAKAKVLKDAWTKR